MEQTKTRREELRENIVKGLAVTEGPGDNFTVGGEIFTVRAYAHYPKREDRKPYKGYHLWVENGSVSLYSDEMVTNYEEREPEIIDKMIERCEEWLDGWIHCSECGEVFPASEARNYSRGYFAGRYCQHCWDTKWKALEAEETYD